MLTNVIARPLHIHGARTPVEYRAIQAKFMAAQQQRLPRYDFPDPWVSSTTPAAYVAMGKWLVRCGCGNAPSVDPGWHLACCFECGAIYESVVVPENYTDIEAELLKRPMAHNRAWMSDESLADLTDQNDRHGISSPEEAG